MNLKQINSYTHSCIISLGGMRGNTYRHEVNASDYEYGHRCPYCGERLVTTKQLLAHIYAQITGE